MSDVDIHRSPVRAFGLFTAACGFTTLCAWMIYAHPGTGRRAVTPGSFAEFAAYVGVAFFGLCAILMVPKLFQRGTVVSVGPRGIYDRRLSTDWIPWQAIVGITPVQIQRQRMLVLQIDSSADAALPWTAQARRMARLNRAFGPHGYWMAAADLRGGFPVLAGAIARSQQGGPVDRHAPNG
jgi:hypothetical protein